MVKGKRLRRRPGSACIIPRNRGEAKHNYREQPFNFVARAGAEIRLAPAHAIWNAGQPPVTSAAGLMVLWVGPPGVAVVGAAAVWGQTTEGIWIG